MLTFLKSWDQFYRMLHNLEVQLSSHCKAQDELAFIAIAYRQILCSGLWWSVRGSLTVLIHIFLSFSKAEVGKLWPTGLIQPNDCLCLTWEQRMTFIFLCGWKKTKECFVICENSMKFQILCQWIKFYWNTATHICLHIVTFCTLTPKLLRHSRSCVVRVAEMFPMWPIINSLFIPGL